MTSAILEVRPLGVLASTIALTVLGGLWFAVLFSKQYAFALGREGQPPQKPGPLFIVGPMICGFVTTLTVAVLLRLLKVETVVDGVRIGFLVGFGLLASTTVNTGINPNIPRPLVYGLVSGGYFLISGVTVCAILVALQ